MKALNLNIENCQCLTLVDCDYPKESSLPAADFVALADDIGVTPISMNRFVILRSVTTHIDARSPSYAVGVIYVRVNGSPLTIIFFITNRTLVMNDFHISNLLYLPFLATTTSTIIGQYAERIQTEKPIVGIT